jgi:hypothetical protein
MKSASTFGAFQFHRYIAAAAETNNQIQVNGDRIYFSHAVNIARRRKPKKF